MKARVLSLVVGSLLGMAFASTAGDEIGGATFVAVDPEGAGPCLGVYLAVLGGPVPFIGVTKAELARVWRLNGVDVRYPRAADPQGCAAASPLQVVVNLVDGRGTRQVAKAARASDAAMAVGVLHAGARLARVYVFLDRARQVLVSGGTPACEQMTLSLMVARLAAHEIGHVLLGSAAHTRDGLMRATYDSRDAWAQPDAAYRLSPSEQAAVHRTLGGVSDERIALLAERSPR